MLEGVAVVIEEVVVIVRVKEKFILFGKNKGAADVGPWKSRLVRFFDGEYILGIIL